MLLKNLIFEQAYQIDPQYLNIEISSIEIDSRMVKPGAIFFALKGTHTDGKNFIDSAFANGAAMVVCDYNFKASCNSDKVIGVPDVYKTLILALQKFYPNLPENILAVTGTNGKTSVAYFIMQLQEMLGKKSASIGTLGIVSSLPTADHQLPTNNLTTPDIVSLYKNLAVLKKHGINDVAIEASSIGLEQKRLAGLKIGLGAFTNFSQDHLDYHGAMEKYFESKMLLFKEVVCDNGVAVLNADIPEFQKIKEVAEKRGLRVFPYGVAGRNVILANAGVHLPGDFQKYNLLCALTSVISYYKLNQDQINLLVNNLDKIKPAEGRMELAATLKNNAKIFIDFAHTPEALRNVLTAAKKMPHNNLYILFGCGGNRDRGKRPQMGKIASQLADYVIITDDNPRNEDPSQIRKEIFAACDANRTIETASRETALYQAILILKNNDILIIAGKGHEKYQIIGDKKTPFDESKIVKEFVSSREL